MTANAGDIVGIDLSPGGVVGLFEPVHSNLRAIDHAIVAFKAHATGHAAVCFFAGFICVGTKHTLVEMAQNVYVANLVFRAMEPRLMRPMAKKQLVRGHDLIVGAILKIVHGVFGAIGAGALDMVVLAGLLSSFTKFVQEVEVMHVDLWQLCLLLPADIVINGIGGD